MFSDFGWEMDRFILFVDFCLEYEEQRLKNLEIGKVQKSRRSLWVKIKEDQFVKMKKF